MVLKPGDWPWQVPAADDPFRRDALHFLGLSEKATDEDAYRVIGRWLGLSYDAVSQRINEDTDDTVSKRIDDNTDDDPRWRLYYKAFVQRSADDLHIYDDAVYEEVQEGTVPHPPPDGRAGDRLLTTVLIPRPDKVGARHYDRMLVWWADHREYRDHTERLAATMREGFDLSGEELKKAARRNYHKVLTELEEALRASRKAKPKEPLPSPLHFYVFDAETMPDYLRRFRALTRDWLRLSPECKKSKRGLTDAEWRRLREHNEYLLANDGERTLKKLLIQGPDLSSGALAGEGFEFRLTPDEDRQLRSDLTGDYAAVLKRVVALWPQRKTPEGARALAAEYVAYVAGDARVDSHRTLERVEQLQACRATTAAARKLLAWKWQQVEAYHGLSENHVKARVPPMRDM